MSRQYFEISRRAFGTIVDTRPWPSARGGFSFLNHGASLRTFLLLDYSSSARLQGKTEGTEGSANSGGGRRRAPAPTRRAAPCLGRKAVQRYEGFRRCARVVPSVQGCPRGQRLSPRCFASVCVREFVRFSNCDLRFVIWQQVRISSQISISFLCMELYVDTPRI